MAPIAANNKMCQHILKSFMLKLVPQSKDLKDGLIYRVFTAPEARGMHIGQRLIEAGIAFFRGAKTWVDTCLSIGRLWHLF